MALSPLGHGAIAWPSPGTVISVPIFFGYRHKGIVSERWWGGKPMVISNSNRAGGAIEEPWNGFCQGGIPTVEGYPGVFSEYEVLHRARTGIGRPYHLLDWNCEHFVLYAHGVKPESAQVLATFALAAFGFALIAAR